MLYTLYRYAYVLYIICIPCTVRRPQTEFTLVAEGSASVRMEAGKRPNITDKYKKMNSKLINKEINKYVYSKMEAGSDHQDETLVPGDYFGERLLEQGVVGARASGVTIVAAEGLATLSITAEEFEDLGLRKHLCFPRRRAMGRHVELRKGSTSELRIKTEAERAFIAEALRGNRNLRALVDLREEGVVEKMCDAAHRKEVPAGAVLVKQGEYGGRFYIIESGSFKLVHEDEDDVGEPEREGTGLAVERLASQMQQRMRRKESFLQCLVHSKDPAGSPQVGGSPWRSGSLRRSGSLTGAARSPASGTPCAGGTPCALQRSASCTLGGDLIAEPAAHRSATGGRTPGGRTPGRRSAPSPYPRLLSRRATVGPWKLPEEQDGPRNDFKLPHESADPATPSWRTGLQGPAGGKDWSCSHMDQSPSPAGGDLPPNVLGVRSAGDSFGEMALLYHAPRTSTAVACEDSVVWHVSQAAFRRVMLRGQQERTDRIVASLSEVAILQGLLSKERQELAQNVLLQTFRRGDFIVREGDRQNVWYVVVRGECVGFSGPAKEELFRLRESHHFGERSLLRGAPSEFSVEASSDEDVVCLVLDGPTFKELAGLLRTDPFFTIAVEADLQKFAEYKGIRKAGSGGALPLRKQSTGTALEAPLQLDPSVGARSLQRLGILGEGAFGVVSLERDPASGQMFALKTLSKAQIVGKDLVQDVVSEREILTMIDSPFCARLLATHKDRAYVYFLFEPLLGGDLHARMHRERRTFSSARVSRFVVACMALALEHLHDRHIVFRDLKEKQLYDLIVLST